MVILGIFVKSVARKIADNRYVPETVFVEMDARTVIIETTVVICVLNIVMFLFVISKTAFADLDVHLKILLVLDVRTVLMGNGT